jgi:TetR/AcrR family transcriptional regulator of autoinduction and epiphytic fitness
MTLTLSQRKHLAIIEGAIVEFKDNGYNASSMDAVAARAQVSKRTVYNHFPSKEALFEELVRQMITTARQVTEFHYNDDLPIERQLLSFAEQELSLLSDSRFLDLSRITMAEAMHSPELARKILSNVAQQDSYLETWIIEAIKRDKLMNVDAKYATRQFLSLIKGLALWPQILTGLPSPDEQTEKQIVGDTVEMFLARYKKV